MKKAIFLLPILALSLFFAFCNKLNVQEAMPSNDSNLPTADRNNCFNLCSLEISADNSTALQVCGLGTNLQQCQACPSISNGVADGVEIVDTYGIFTVCAGIKIVVTNLDATTTDVRLITPNSISQTVTLNQGDCAAFILDANCEFQ